VLGAADRRERPQPPALAEFLHAGAPLGGAVVVAHAFAGEDLPAADDADGVQLLHFARGRRGGGLVETAHAARDVAGADARQSFESEPSELETAVTGVATEGGRALAARARGGGLVAAEQAHLAAAPQQPAGLRRTR